MQSVSHPPRLFVRRLSYEFLFSLYLSLLVMAVEEMRDFSWSTSIRLLLFSYFNPKGRRPIDDPHAERAISFVAGGPETVSVHFLLEPWRTEGAPGSFFEPGSWAFIFLHFCIYSLLAGGPETVSVHFLLEPWRTEGGGWPG